MQISVAFEKTEEQENGTDKMGAVEKERNGQREEYG